jgi:hypothetical protein
MMTAYDPAGADRPLYVIGDIHGQRVELMSLLLESGIVDDQLHWAAGNAQVWFVGDYVDRGPDGIGTIDLVIDLDTSAIASGGSVGGLLGNHDLLLLMAHRFGDRAESTVTGLTFLGEWLAGGGQRSDLAGLTAERVEWLSRRPVMALVDDRLIVHSDSLWYLEYGHSVGGVNAAVRSILAGDDPVEWDRLLGAMSTRFAFVDARGGSDDAARLLLATFGGSQVVHGHTPIALMTGTPVEEVEEPHVYASGLAVNVDGAMYLGGRGVVLAVRDGTLSSLTDRA